MLKIAIVGTGNIAPTHIQALLTFPEKCKIVALVDIYPEKAERMKEKYNLDCVVLDDHKKLFESNLEIDLVHVCTPPYTHSEIAINCMNHKLNVVVEKPMAPSVKECDMMLASAEENGVLLSSIAQNRFQNAVYKLKQVVDSGIAGNVRVAHINSFWWRGHNYYDLWWRGLWSKEGGGPTLNHAVHHIDMLNWIQEKSPEELVAMLGNVMHDNSEVEDISFATMVYDDNAMAEVVSSVVHHGEEQGIVLQCEKAKISSPWTCKAEVSTSNGFPKPNTEKMEELDNFYNSLPDLEYTGHTGQIHDIIEALINNRKPLVTGIDGKRTIELITAIYKSGSLKQYVQLPLKEDDPFYTFDGLLENAVRFYEKTGNVENFEQVDISTGNY